MNAVVERVEEQAPVASPVIQSEGAALISMIERAARDPNVDVDKMMKLLEMKERVETEQARKAFNSAMSAAQAEMPQVVRTAKNTQTSSKYAKLESVSEAMQPVIAKFGFGMSYGTDVCPVPGCTRVTCVVTHRDGGEKLYFADVPNDGTGMKGVANKTATHAFASTVSYGRRILKLMIFDVATKDDDGNSAGRGESVSPEQVETLQRKIVAVGADLPRFLRFLKVEKLEELQASKFQDAMAALIEKEARHAD